MINSLITPAVKLLLALVVLLFSTSCFYYWGLNSWLEQQRVFELALLALACLLFTTQKQLRLPLTAVWLLVAIFFVGWLSSSAAAYPEWAVKEWAKSFGLLALVLVLANYAKQYDVMFFERLALLLVVAATLFFLAFYASAYVAGARALNPNLMYVGFDNPRFYAQVIILLLPMALVPVCQLRGTRYTLLFGMLCGVLALQWALLIALGGRGSLLAICLAHFAVWCFCPRWRGFVYAQLGLVFLGLLFYGVLFWLLPWLFGLELQGASALRSGLSLREVVWQGAYAMAAEHPWLGVGPLHFSADWNHIAAHPHQAILQWAAEWGWFVACAMCVLISWGCWQVLTRLRVDSSVVSGDVALWIGVVGGLCLSLLDGVFVMPYTEVWLALLAGLLLGRFAPSVRTLAIWPLKVMALFAMLTMVWIIVAEVPYLYEAQTNFWDEEAIGSPPRFWDQGWIPMQSPPP